MPEYAQMAAAAIGGGALVWACNRGGKNETNKGGNEDEILQFWFYNEPVEKMQHRLWFCPEGGERQTEVDREITARFKKNLENILSGKWHPNPANPRSLLAGIILLDQISRHIYRYEEKGRPGAESNIASIALSEKLFESQQAWTELTPVQLVFALLPYRHHKSDLETEKRYHQKSLALLSKIDARLHSDSAVLTRFKTATVRRYQALTDINPPGEGILEKEEFKPSPEIDEKKPREAIVRTIAKFFLNRDGCMDNGVVCVSLSGGVDSMVIADVLVHLRDHPKPVERARKGQGASAADRRVKHNVLEKQTIGMVKKIIAVHIDYGNRLEANDEADFIQDWCERRDIIFVKKSIEELKRATASRDEYEALTRNIRYDEYRKAMKTHGVTGICLGHHSGDIVENLLSNANRGCGVLDLSGMREVTLMEDVPVWRPLLPHNKDEIFNFAHTYGVPYFKDTTPSWSTRGKLRNNLLPCLEDTYGKGTSVNLHSLALESDNLREVVHTRLITPFVEKNISRHAAGIALKISGYEDHGRLFWKELFKQIQHTIFNTAMLSDTALREVAVRLALTGFEDGDKKFVTAPQEGWVEPKRGMFWYFEKHILYIPNPCIFNQPFKTAGCIQIGGPPVTVGVWKLVASFKDVLESDLGDPRCTDHRSLPVPCRAPPFSSWNEFLSGTFSYALQVPQDTTALDFQDAKTVKLPWCWKKLHQRYHTSLPIACSRPVETDEFKLVEVRYTYQG
eukprot:TRINITY_DN8333_c0_g1_i1.p1 TRINITY_DN8333_c0_g1~~TRINITY_DN8333_c0_g1_i1.p1  ORF type:complete len:759 (+),score=114.67 TRINITY_DN8333_c0_g1_i1:62-2278(+)